MENKIFFKITGLFIILFSITSCGFKPIYKASLNPTYDYLQNIEITPISSPEGADYYNHLKNIFPTTLHAKYKLNTSIVYSKDFSIIQRNSDVTRELVTVLVKYDLIDTESEKVITSDKFSRLTSFSTNFSPYGNHTKQLEVQKALAVMAAEEIRNRLILFIENNIK
jgi:hypothetical protein